MAYWGEIEFVKGTQNIPENYTPVTANFYVVSDTGSSWSNYTTYADCTLDGTTETKTISSFNFGNNKRLLLGSITKNVRHNSDGTKTASASFTWKSNHSLIGTVTGSASLELTRIPRTSSVSCNSFNIGDATTIVISRASSSFTHTVTWAFGNESGTIATKTSQTTIGTTISASKLYAQIPSAKYGKGTITCQTYSGNTLIGTSTCSFTAYAKESDCIPNVSATITDTNDTTFALTGSRTKFIKGFSHAKVAISATPKNSAKISSYYTSTGDGRTSSSSSPQFNNILSNYIAVKTTDSRGYSKTVEYWLDWIEYVSLVFTAIRLERTESTADTVNLILQGNYYNGGFGNANNSLTLKYRYKESGGTYSDWTTITPTISDNTFSYTKLFDNLDHNKEYIFDFTASDKLMTANSGEVVLTQGIPIIRVGKDYVKVNGEKVFTSPDVQYHGDGTYDILVAEITLDRAYRRDSLVFSAVEVGSSDNYDTGIVLVGFSSNENNETSESNTSITVLGNIQVYVTTSGNNAKLYVKKTIHYRNLHIQLINKSSDRVIWYG